MKGIGKRLKTILLVLFLACSAAAAWKGTTIEAQAATKRGFIKINGEDYYLRADGTKYTGWLTFMGHRYYFYSSGKLCRGWRTFGTYRYYFANAVNPVDCYMATGWMQDSEGNRRYFLPDGKMATGWQTIDKITYYFSKWDGVMKKGWITIDGAKYFLNKTTGALYRNVLVTDSKGVSRYFSNTGKMATTWFTFADGRRRYFSPTGEMARGFVTVSGRTFYFHPETGYVQTGWIKNTETGTRYYMDPKNKGAMAVSTTLQIAGDTYEFDVNGIATLKQNTTGPVVEPSTGSKTIKNYLLGAMQPLGQALYVWGGGWNDATRKGVSPTWKQWYDSQSSSYNYNYYRDLSVSTRAKGLDCSGFVGWCAYQVMHTESGVGHGYTVVSGDVGPTYRTLGWGNIMTSSAIAADGYKLYPGDVGYNDGHTWIIVGQCSDKSCVIIHSTPNAGCQLAGTPTPSGNYLSEAITLARQYMSKFSGYNKYSYSTSTGNYVPYNNYFRWSSQTLGDPDGYRNMTAAEILADLFS